MVDRDKIARISPVISDFVRESVDVPLCTQTGLKLSRARDDRDLCFVFEFTYAVQAIANYAQLGVELSRICHLLKIAAAAGADVGARRLYACSSRLDDRLDLGKCDLTLYLAQPDIEPVTGNREIDK